MVPAARLVTPLFVLLARRSPSSTLFPYTTLFRSQVLGRVLHRAFAEAVTRKRDALQDEPDALARNGRAARQSVWFIRSEEHTSELQSLRHLVCRLLLEKKKKPQQSARTSNINAPR